MDSEKKAETVRQRPVPSFFIFSGKMGRCSIDDDSSILQRPSVLAKVF